jgi:hypothetical protein
VCCSFEDVGSIDRRIRSLLKNSYQPSAKNKKHRLLTRAAPFRGATVRERCFWPIAEC